MSGLTPAMRAFLEEPRFAVFGTTNPSGSPHLTVMWYLLEADEIVMNTRRGRAKERNLRRDPRASFMVMDGYNFVRIDGPIRIIEDPRVGYEDIRSLAIRYHGEEVGDRQARDTFSQQERITLRLPIEKVYSDGI